MGGRIDILDPRSYIDETNYVLWDGKSDFELLFKDSGFDVKSYLFETNKGNKLSSVYIEKVQDDRFPKEKVSKNCLVVFGSKKRKLREMKSKDPENTKLQNLWVEIVEQIVGYKEKSVEGTF